MPLFPATVPKLTVNITDFLKYTDDLKCHTPILCEIKFSEIVD